tara:strand:- start:20 stop:739 length:720 start_codon:yes stop_codon:yes gene_type:complete
MSFAQDSNLVVSPELDFITQKNNDKSPSATLDLEILVASTIGEFKEFYENDEIGGLGFTFLFGLHKTIPVDLGFDFGYYFMSTNRSRLEYYAPGLGDYDVNSKVNGTMVPIHLVGRLTPFKNTDFFIQPYVEVMAGFRIFVVKQTIETTLLNTGVTLDPETESTTNGAFSYGYGAGLKVKISKEYGVFLNIKANQIYGSATKYINQESVVLMDDGSYQYKTTKSKTDILRFSIGLQFQF